MLIVETTKKWNGFHFKKKDMMCFLVFGFFIFIKIKISFDEYCNFLLKHGENLYKKEQSNKNRAIYKRKKMNKINKK